MKSLAIRREAASGKRSMSDDQEIIPNGKAPLVRPWTEEDDARLLQMIAQKRHRSIIAARLKRTRSGISGRLWLLRRGGDDPAK